MLDLEAPSFFENRTVWHGGECEVSSPRIINGRFTKDFGTGFYVASMLNQAIRWSMRFKAGVVSEYCYTKNTSLNILEFTGMNEEWLDFVANCRYGIQHNFDIVEGPMADDTIFNYIDDYMNGVITREAFWVLVKFKHPTHQISFNSEKALRCLRYVGCSSHDTAKWGAKHGQ